ncbi:hypothetical protein WAK64_15295 [Bacillus spongiae]|uniref:Uncharacterized protein n=1 Tax=Bacillus spongiae TaxID=2683610 RepID=A0ABU8HGD5_9BACI
MSHYVLYLVLGIIFFVSGCVIVYNGYQPKVGPIGNGPNYKLIWFQFFILAIYSITAFIKSFLLFKLEKKNSKDDE